MLVTDHVYTQQHIPLSHMPLYSHSHWDTCAWVPVLTWGIIASTSLLSRLCKLLFVDLLDGRVA